MNGVLIFFQNILSEPAFLMGLIAFVGLLALKTPGHKVLTGSTKNFRCRNNVNFNCRIII